MRVILHSISCDGNIFSVCGQHCSMHWGAKLSQKGGEKRSAMVHFSLISDADQLWLSFSTLVPSIFSFLHVCYIWFNSRDEVKHCFIVTFLSILSQQLKRELITCNNCCWIRSFRSNFLRILSCWKAFLSLYVISLMIWCCMCLSYTKRYMCVNCYFCT